MLGLDLTHGHFSDRPISMWLHSHWAGPPHTAGPSFSQTQMGLCSALTKSEESPNSWGSRHVSGDPAGPVQEEHTSQPGNMQIFNPPPHKKWLQSKSWLLLVKFSSRYLQCCFPHISLWILHTPQEEGQILFCCIKYRNYVIHWPPGSRPWKTHEWKQTRDKSDLNVC